MKYAFLSAAVAAVLVSTAMPVQADVVEAVPTPWRVQDYGSTYPTSIYIFYTGSSCASGSLVAPSSMESGKDRLWASIMTAKLTNKKIGIYYHVDNGSCLIDSFYLPEGS